MWSEYIHRRLVRSPLAASATAKSRNSCPVYGCSQDRGTQRSRAIHVNTPSSTIVLCSRSPLYTRRKDPPRAAHRSTVGVLTVALSAHTTDSTGHDQSDAEASKSSAKVARCPLSVELHVPRSGPSVGTAGGACPRPWRPPRSIKASKFKISFGA